MAIDRLETRSIPNFLNSLQPPVHVILLYTEPSELDDIKSKIMVEASSSETPHKAADRVYSASLTPEGTAKGWVINTFGREALSDPARLIGLEERVREARQPQMVLCAYPLMHITELNESIFIDILSLHDYVLFSRFVEGQKMVIEAVEEALRSSLGDSGSEMIYRFAHHMGIEREQIPGELQRFRLVLRKLLGIGADLLERFIFRRLYLKLRSSPQVARVDG